MALQRTEYKFLISAELKNRLQSDLILFTHRDSHNFADSENWITSYYFDTFARDSYVQKTRQATYRYKARFRFYSKSSKEITQPLGKFEWKSKLYGETTKTFWDASWSLLNNILTNKPIEFATVEEQRVINMLKTNNLMPTLKIRYTREAFFCKLDSSVRITLDHNLMVAQYDSDINYPFLSKNYYILEIKSEWGNLWPLWLKNIIEKYRLTQVSYSKYFEATSHLLKNARINNFWI